MQIKSPRDAFERYLSTNRRQERQGLVLGKPYRKISDFPTLETFPKFASDSSRESDAFAKFVRKMKIKVSDHSQLAGTLSGNQQVVVLAKWLQKSAEVIFDEPTRGIDVGAKFEIYQILQSLAEDGKAILMISSELPEILGMSDRIIVMNEGRVTGEIKDCSSATQEDVMKLATQREKAAA